MVGMEISVAGNDSIRIKGKNVTLIADPASKSGPADISLSLKKGTIPLKVEGVRLQISGEGEYEVGGVKITGVSADSQIVFTGEVDGVRFVIGEAQALEKALSKLDETQVAIIKVLGSFNPQIITGLGPNASLLYGLHRDGALNELGKKELTPVSKYVVKKDLLAPEAEEIVALG